MVKLWTPGYEILKSVVEEFRIEYCDGVKILELGSEFSQEENLPDFFIKM